MTVSTTDKYGRTQIFIPKANELVKDGHWIFADSLEKVEPDPVWVNINNLETRIQALELQVSSMSELDID